MIEINKDLKAFKEECKRRSFYLISPFSHPDKEIEKQRYLEQQKYHAWLIKECGAVIIAPIELCYHLHINHGLPGGYEFWKTRDRAFIDITDGVIICEMEGLEQSVGCQDEISYAIAQKKMIYTVKL